MHAWNEQRQPFVDRLATKQSYLAIATFSYGCEYVDSYAHYYVKIYSSYFLKSVYTIKLYGV